MIELKDVKPSLKKFISETSFTDIEKIKDDSMIFREGFFDSMGLMSLITFLEDNLNIHIKDADLIEENFESINAMYRFIEGKSNNHS